MFDLPTPTTYLNIWRHMWMLPNRFGAEQTSWQKRVIRNFQEKEKKCHNLLLCHHISRASVDTMGNVSLSSTYHQCNERFGFKSFKSLSMPTLTKFRNQTLVGSGDPDSAQWFCHWRSSFSNNGYPPFKGTTRNQNLFPRKDFYFLPIQAQKLTFENSLENKKCLIFQVIT